MDATQRQHIAQVIQTSRLQRGWTVGQAAEMIGVDPSGWSRWETANTIPRPARLVEIGELFNLPADWATPPATLSQPVTTVDPDELLVRIRAEFDGFKSEVQQMLDRHMRGDDKDDDRTDALGDAAQQRER